MLDLRRCPRTSATLERLGVRLDTGKPYLPAEWDSQTALHLRGSRAEHPQRQDAARQCGLRNDPTAIPFLGWVLLTDSWRHTRAEAVRSLRTFPLASADALLTLALADRSGLVVKTARETLALRSTPTHFAVILTLWEDRALADAGLDHLRTLAQRAPHLQMRQALPVLERHARRLFLSPLQRRRLRETIEALDQATIHLKDLPLAATGHLDTTSLPVPAPSVAPEPTRRPWWAFWQAR